MTDPYMKDYFFNSMPKAKLKHSKTYSNIFNNRPSSFNLSGSEIVYNNNGVNNKKNLIAARLKNNNILAHKQLDEINNEYYNMKNFLNDKVSQLEQQQQKQFEALKNYLDENNLLEDLRQKEDNRNNMINEFKDIMDYEINKKKDLEKIRNLDYKEKLGRKKAKENLEREKFMREMDYFEKIQRLDYMERILLHQNKMKQRAEEMYQNRYFNPYTGLPNSPFMSPLLLDLINSKNENNKQNEIFKLFLLKSIMDDDKPKKDRPLFVKPPKYFIQKYYPPAPSTNLIPVPQPILFKSPDPPPPQVIYQREPIRIMPSPEIIMPPKIRQRKTEYISIPTKHKHSHKHKHRHKHDSSSNESGQSDQDENNSEEKEDNQEDDNKSKEKSGEESTQPDIRLRLYDPDNPDNDKIVYPENNQE